MSSNTFRHLLCCAKYQRVSLTSVAAQELKTFSGKHALGGRPPPHEPLCMFMWFQESPLKNSGRKQSVWSAWQRAANGAYSTASSTPCSPTKRRRPYVILLGATMPPETNRREPRNRLAVQKKHPKPQLRQIERGPAALTAAFKETSVPVPESQRCMRFWEAQVMAACSLLTE